MMKRCADTCRHVSQLMSEWSPEYVKVKGVVEVKEQVEALTDTCVYWLQWRMRELYESFFAGESGP